jgi:energy-converting hydrogenase Eha subunit A
VVLRVLLVLAVTLLVAGGAAAQPMEGPAMIDGVELVAADEAIVETVELARLPRTEPARASHTDDAILPSPLCARVFRPPR